MSIYVHYDTLSWDRIAELPRDTPLVLPLGSGYSQDLLSSELGDPGRIGLLT